jgi:hypothetical protein
MTSLSGTRIFYQNDRLFEPLLTFWVTLDAIALATECMKTGRVDKTPGNLGIETSEFRLWIKFPALITEALASNTPVTGFQMIFSQNEGRKGNQIGPIMFGYKNVTMGILTAIYVAFYEKHIGWMQANLGTDRNAWPALLQFAWAIRNFIVHHAGKVNLPGKTPAPVSWHHFTFGPADTGTQAIGFGAGRIGLGELIVLLTEFGDELDQLGCPIIP